MRAFRGNKRICIRYKIKTGHLKQLRAPVSIRGNNHEISCNIGDSGRKDLAADGPTLKPGNHRKGLTRISRFQLKVETGIPILQITETSRRTACTM